MAQVDAGHDDLYHSDEEHSIPLEELVEPTARPPPSPTSIKIAFSQSSERNLFKRNQVVPHVQIDEPRAGPVDLVILDRVRALFKQSPPPRAPAKERKVELLGNESSVPEQTTEDRKASPGETLLDHKSEPAPESPRVLDEVPMDLSNPSIVATSADSVPTLVPE